MPQNLDKQTHRNHYEYTINDAKLSPIGDDLFKVIMHIKGAHDLRPFK